MKPLVRFVSTAIFATCLVTVIGGCSSSVETEANKLVVKHGDAQCGIAGSEAKPVVLEVLGPQRRGLLGGKGARHPVPNVQVRFEPLDPASGLQVVGEPELVSDNGGFVRGTVVFGDRFGDQYLKAYVVDDPDISLTLRFVSGIERTGHGQETIAGRLLPRPMRLTVRDEDGNPVPDVPVYFTLMKKPGKGGSLAVLNGVTDAEGMARADLETDGSKTGSYEVLAEVADPERGYTVRGIVFKEMALNRLGLVVGVLGGLGIFLFGMKLMSDGLQHIAGNRLKGILHFLTRNRFAAVGAGTVVTGLIQSSSACTVMVVGFVNAGLLSLRQAIGVIFGANIGTTVTGQMVSFKLTGLALPAIAVGMAVILVARRSKVKNAAQAVLGFGLLFLGMTMMSSELKSIASFPTFRDIFQFFDCTPAVGGGMPVGAILGSLAIGTVMTVMVQSSSATIGLTIALADSGLINFYTAVPLILGDNIGTTVTALLASIGTNRRARQAAVAHTIFNLLGAAYMCVLFYVPVGGVPVFLKLVNNITSGDVFAAIPENIGRHVAAAHTLFNIFNVIIFLPFVGTIAWLCNVIIPIREDGQQKVKPLEPHLLDTPSLALPQAVNAMAEMADAAWSLAVDALEGAKHGKVRDREDLMTREALIDDTQHDIIQYLAQLTQRELNEAEASLVPLIIHCVNDAERIGDLAVNLVELADQLADGKEMLSEEAIGELDHLAAIIGEQEHLAHAALGLNGRHAAAEALKLEGEVNRLTLEFEKKHIQRLEKQKCSVRCGIVYTELLRNLERVADHLANIAERAHEISEVEAGV